MKKNLIQLKSFDFAIRMVRLFQYLQTDKGKYILSKQLLRSGTSVGAMIREAEHSESKADFIHKMAIAQKEINESIYWIDLLNGTGYLDEIQFASIKADAIELIKMITSILKTTKHNLKKDLVL